MLSSFSLVLTRAQIIKWRHPYSGGVFPQLTLFGKPLTDMPIGQPDLDNPSLTVPSSVIPDPATT